MQMLLFWMMVTSSKDQAAKYLYDSREWAEMIATDRKDKLLGNRRFHIVSAWWTAHKGLLEGSSGTDTVDRWLGVNSGDDLGIWKRTECKEKFSEMVASLTSLFADVQKELVSDSCITHKFC